MTGQEFAKTKEGTVYPAGGGQTFPREAWFSRRDAKAYGVVLDVHGKIVWGRSDIGGDPIVVVLSERVGKHVPILPNREQASREQFRAEMVRALQAGQAPAPRPTAPAPPSPAPASASPVAPQPTLTSPATVRRAAQEPSAAAPSVDNADSKTPTSHVPAPPSTEEVIERIPTLPGWDPTLLDE